MLLAWTPHHRVFFLVGTHKLMQAILDAEMSTFSSKHVAIVIQLAVAVSIFAIVVYIAKPWFISSERVRDDVLKLMPIGTGFEDACNVIESKNRWYVLTLNGLVLWSSVSDEFIRDSADRKTIRLSVRDYGYTLYYVFFEIDVVLRFDDDFNLAEVEVRKYLNP